MKLKEEGGKVRVLRGGFFFVSFSASPRLKSIRLIIKLGRVMCNCDMKTEGPNLASLPDLSLIFARKVDIRVYDAHVPRERIAARKCLLLHAVGAANLLLSIIMNRVLVAREIVGARKDGIARLVGRGVQTFALVRTCLAVSIGTHTNSTARCTG